MGFKSGIGGQQISKGVYLAGRNSCGMAVERYESHNSRKLQHTPLVFERHAHENVTRKQCEFQLLAAVLPAPNRSVQWQKAGEASPLNLSGDKSFVSGTGIQRIPIFGGRCLDRQR